MNWSEMSLGMKLLYPGLVLGLVGGYGFFIIGGFLTVRWWIREYKKIK
jgi:hypothetical protein